MRKIFYSVFVLFLVAGCGKEGGIPEPGPQPVPESDTKFQISLIDGVYDYNGLEQMASGTIRLLNGSDAYYDVEYSIDDDEHVFSLRNILVGKLVDFQWPESLEWGEHEISGTIVCEESDVKPVSFRETFWMKGHKLRTIKASTESKYRSLSPSEGETVGLAVGESGILQYTYEPASTMVIPTLDIDKTSLLNVDLKGVETGAGFVRFPFSVLDTGFVAVRCILRNGPADSLVHSFCVNTGADRPHTVMEVSVPGNLSFRIGDVGSFSVGYFPEDAKDARIVSVEPSSPDIVAKVDGMKVSLTAKNVGDYTVKVLVGDAKVAGTVNVKVIGSMVTDVYIEENFDGRIMEVGEQTVIHITSVPADAYDASSLKVESFDTKVLTVSYDKANAYIIKAVGCGRAVIAVSAGTSIRKSFSMDVIKVDCPSSVTFDISQKGSIRLSATPSNCPEAFVASVRSSSSNLIAGINGFGVDLSAKLPGTYSVDLTIGNVGIRRTVNVVVTGKTVTGINVSENLSGLVLVPGQTKSFQVTVSPSDAYDAGTLKVESTDVGVMSVGMTGGSSYILRPQSAGTASIVITAGQVRKEYKVETFDVSCPENMSMDITPGTGRISLSAVPSGSKEAFVKSVISSSSDLVATASGFGVALTAKYPGTYNVDLTIGNVGLKKSVKVNVTGVAVSDIVVSPDFSGRIIQPEEEFSVSIYGTPTTAFNANDISVTSSVPSVVSVARNGSFYTIKGLKGGRTTVVATDGRKIKKEYTVEVFSVECTNLIQRELKKNVAAQFKFVPEDCSQAVPVACGNITPGDFVVWLVNNTVMFRAEEPGIYSIWVEFGAKRIRKTFTFNVIDLHR